MTTAAVLGRGWTVVAAMAAGSGAVAPEACQEKAAEKKG